MKIRKDNPPSADHHAMDLQGLWAGLGISIGAGIGAPIGLVGWGAEGIAFGLVLGAGIGLVLGASYDRVDRRRRRDAGEDAT